MKKLLLVTVSGPCMVGLSALCAMLPLDNSIQYNAMMSAKTGTVAGGLKAVSHSENSGNTYYLAKNGSKDDLKYLDSNNQPSKEVQLSDVGSVYVLGGFVIALQHSGRKVFLSKDDKEPSFVEVSQKLLDYPEITAVYVVSDSVIEIYYVWKGQAENCFYVAIVNTSDNTLKNEKVTLPGQNDRVSAFCYNSTAKNIDAVVSDSIFSISPSDHSLNKIIDGGFQSITGLFTYENEFIGWGRKDLQGVIYADGQTAAANKWTNLGKVNDVNLYQNWNFVFATDANSLWYKSSEDISKDPVIYSQFWNNLDIEHPFSEHDSVLTMDNNLDVSNRFYANVIPKSSGQSNLYYSINEVTPLVIIHETPWTPYTPAIPAPKNNNLGLIIGLSVGIPLAAILISASGFIIYRRNKIKK